jgi:hypothetical protein
MKMFGLRPSEESLESFMADCMEMLGDNPSLTVEEAARAVARKWKSKKKKK